MSCKSMGLALALAAALPLAACTGDDNGDGDGGQEGGGWPVCTPDSTRPCTCDGVESVSACDSTGTTWLRCQCPVCTPGTTKPCNCAGGVASVAPCADDGLSWDECRCSGSDAGGGDSGGRDAGAQDRAQVDTGIEPANCVDEAEVDLGALERKKPRSGWMVLRERFRHDTTPIEALVQATFRDYSQYNGTPGQEVAINSHCVGYVGEPTPSDRHCEYTETPCEGDGDCEAGVSCRDFDRLSVNGVRFNGVVGYDDGLDLDRVERGFYEKTGLTELFSSTAINLRTGGVSDPTQHGFYEYSGFYFDIDTPVEIRVQTPALDGSRSLSQGEVAFKWNAASGDIDGVQIMVGIDVRADQKKVGSSQTRPLHLKCVATDDACLVLRQEAIDFLLQSDAEWEQADDFSVSVRRVKIYDEVWGLPSDTEYVFDMSYEVVGTLAP